MNLDSLRELKPERSFSHYIHAVTMIDKTRSLMNCCLVI